MVEMTLNLMQLTQSDMCEYAELNYLYADRGHPEIICAPRGGGGPPKAHESVLGGGEGPSVHTHLKKNCLQMHSKT